MRCWEGFTQGTQSLTRSAQRGNNCLLVFSIWSRTVAFGVVDVLERFHAEGAEFGAESAEGK